MKGPNLLAARTWNGIAQKPHSKNFSLNSESVETLFKNYLSVVCAGNGIKNCRLIRILVWVWYGYGYDMDMGWSSDSFKKSLSQSCYTELWSSDVAWSRYNNDFFVNDVSKYFLK